MASLLRGGVLARGIARNFSVGPAADPLFRGVRNRAAAHHHQYLDARIFSSASVANNQLLRGIRDRAAAHHHQFLDARNFSSAPGTNNVNSESDFFSQLEKDRMHSVSILRIKCLGIEIIRKRKLSFNQVMKSKFKGSNLPPLKPYSCQSDPTEHQIDLSASSLIEYVNRLLEEEWGCDIVYGAMYMVYTDPRFQTYDEVARMKVLSKVLDVIQHYPEANWKKVKCMRGYIKSSTVDDSILSYKQVESRVLGVVKSHLPRLNRSIYFYDHLKLNYFTRKRVIAALESEFKMYLPKNIYSCESAINHIYHNQKKRMSLQRFRDEFSYAWTVQGRFISYFLLLSYLLDQSRFITKTLRAAIYRFIFYVNHLPLTLFIIKINNTHPDDTSILRISG